MKTLKRILRRRMRLTDRLVPHTSSSVISRATAVLMPEEAKVAART